MTEPITAFSSSSENAITRTIDVNPDTAEDKLSVEEFNDYYEIEETAAEILKNDYKRVWFQLQSKHILICFTVDSSTIPG
jgi:diphthamide biosynthesis protein 2